MWHYRDVYLSRLFGCKQQKLTLSKKRVYWKDMQDKQDWKIRFREGKGLRGAPGVHGLTRVLLLELMGAQGSNSWEGHLIASPWS